MTFLSKLIVALKITGAASLGILSGVQLDFAQNTLQAILQSTSASQAQRAFTLALGLLRSWARPLELISTLSLLSAWALSPKSGKHPYLWFAATPVLLSIGIEKLKLSGVEYGVQKLKTKEETVERRMVAQGDVEVNGEVVRAGIEEWRRWGVVRGAIVGVGFGLSLVGLYGDRFA